MVPRDNQTESVRWFRFDSPLLFVFMPRVDAFCLCFNNHFLFYNNFGGLVFFLRATRERDA
jgi:hypothetical protein